MEREDGPSLSHGCGSCRFLGYLVCGERAYDLYFCKPHADGSASVLARYGARPSAYLSACESVVRQWVQDHTELDGEQPLVEALRRAQEKGLVK